MISYRNAALLFVLGVVSVLAGMLLMLGGPYPLARMLLAIAVVNTILSLAIGGLRFFRPQ
jgi:hypothetical protein